MYSTVLSYLYSAKNLLSNGNGEQLQVDRLAASSVVVNQARSDNSSNITRKLVCLGVVSAAVVGSAFYISYRFAKKHRFILRETVKNDQVIVSTQNFNF